MVQRSAGSRGEGSAAETVRRGAVSTCFNSRLHRMDPVCLLRGRAGHQTREVNLKQKSALLRDVCRRCSGEQVGVPE
jgi:hypothetical protein